MMNFLFLKMSKTRILQALIVCTAFVSVFDKNASAQGTGILGKNNASNYQYSRSNNANEIEGVKLAAKGDWAEASSIAASAKDPMIATLIDWYWLRSDSDRIDFISLAGFIKNNSDWPRVREVRLKAEEVFPRTYPDSYVVQWFETYAPIGYDGMLKYGDALLKTKKQSALKKALGEWFPKADLSTKEQAAILARFGKYSAKETLIQRINILLPKKEYTNARAVARQIGAGYPALIEARIGLISRKKDVNALIDKVPATLQNDAGMMIDRAKWRRRDGNITGAAQILSDIGGVSDKTLRKAMWKERHIIIRELMDQKRYKDAFSLAQKHQQKDGFPHAQAQWVNGWLALRFVNEPMKAFQHFEALYKTVSTPVSKARGAYWAARASEKLGDNKTANLWYAEAGRYSTAFYGQLALDKIGRKASYASLREKAPSGSSFNNKDKVRAAILLHKAGLQSDAEAFLTSMFKDAENGVVRFEDIAKLSNRLGAPHLGVLVSKKAQNYGFIFLNESFPKLNPTTLASLDKKSVALIHGLIRQESSFNPKAVSRSGALGLMQLMPATARETSGKIGKKYSKANLTRVPSYNVQLGSYYIHQMLNRFDQSQHLAIAAYNGGPGRVSGWLKTMGDPRGLEHYAFLDWLESIPIYETRNYVQRVTESMRVYEDIFSYRRPSGNGARFND